MSSDNFNIYIDPEIRGTPGLYKNIDDVLVSASNMGMLEQRMEKMLQVCLKKNMKLNPDKAQLGHRVDFGGVTIETKTKGDDERRVYILSKPNVTQLNSTQSNSKATSLRLDTVAT